MSVHMPAAVAASPQRLLRSVHCHPSKVGITQGRHACACLGRRPCMQQLPSDETCTVDGGHARVLCTYEAQHACGDCPCCECSAIKLVHCEGGHMRQPFSHALAGGATQYPCMRQGTCMQPPEHAAAAEASLYSCLGCRQIERILAHLSPAAGRKGWTGSTCTGRARGTLHVDDPCIDKSATIDPWECN